MLLKGFFGFLLLVGVFFTGFGVYFIAYGNEARDWPTVEGTIESVRVRSDLQMTGNTPRSREERERRRQYYPSISYRWEVDGHAYTGSRYRLGTTHEKFNEREDAVAAAVKFRNGAPIAVYYNPQNPSEAVLDKSLSGAVFAPLLLGLLFAPVGWLGLRHDARLKAALAKGHAEPLDLA